MTIVTVYDNSGNDVSVQELRDQVAYNLHGDFRFVCVTYLPVEEWEGIECVPFMHLDWQWPWSRLEVFRKAIYGDGERVLYFEPGCKVVNDITQLLENKELMITLKKDDMRVVSWENGAWDKVYREFAKQPLKYSRHFRNVETWFYTATGGQAKFWDKVAPGEVGPEGTRIICP